jgi:hypothetical protein
VTKREKGYVMKNEITIYGIDPGPEESGLAVLQLPENFVAGFVYKNKVVEETLGRDWNSVLPFPIEVAIEWVANYGMAVGQETFKTCFQAGRFSKCNEQLPYDLIIRADVKLTLCGNMKAKDSHLRQQIIDMFGGKEKAIGGNKCKKCKGKKWFGAGRPVCTQCDGTGWLNPPGPLASVKSHAWSALAVALTYAIKRGYLTPSVVNPSGLCRNSQP